MVKCKRMIRKMDGAYLCDGKTSPRMSRLCKECREVKHLGRRFDRLDKLVWRDGWPQFYSWPWRTRMRREYHRKRR